MKGNEKGNANQGDSELVGLLRVPFKYYGGDIFMF